MLDKSISEDLTAVTLNVTMFSADSLLLSLSLNSLSGHCWSGQSLVTTSRLSVQIRDSDG